MGVNFPIRLCAYTRYDPEFYWENCLEQTGHLAGNMPAFLAKYSKGFVQNKYRNDKGESDNT